MTRFLKHCVLLVLVNACYMARPDASSAQTFVTPRGEAQNVRFEQRADGVVHISYDLVASDMRGVFSVRLEASQDEGGNFDVTPQTISGDAGDGIIPGPRKLIIWDSGKDVERLRLDRVRFRIVATGGPLKVEEPAPKPQPVAIPQPAAIPAVAKPKGGSKAKWLIPLVGVAGAGGVLAATAGGSSSTPQATTTTPTTTTTTPPTTTPTTTPTIQCQYTVAPATFALGAAGGATQTATVTTTSGCAWTATSNAAFLAIAGAASSVGSGSFNFTLETNSSTNIRTGTLSVAGQFVTVTQQGTSPDGMTIASFNPVPGSTLTTGNPGTGGASATVRYVLGSRQRAFVCVQAVIPFASGSACEPIEVRAGSGTVIVRFSVLPSAPGLPFTTTQMNLFMGDTAQFGTTTFFRSMENATFNWRLPGAPFRSPAPK